MEELKISIFLLPQKSVSPQINYSETDVENDPSYLRILKFVGRRVEESKKMKLKKCDISVDVENQKVSAVRRLLEKRGYSVFIQGVYV
ncbi:MAG: hypothetical protein HYS53_01335 [Candidatus Aenigmarchaeota archaeon]|nr:hypothetical protein [Candidatus Aenigmarchaeota archaeon]